MKLRIFLLLILCLLLTDAFAQRSRRGRKKKEEPTVQQYLSAHFIFISDTWKDTIVRRQLTDTSGVFTPIDYDQPYRLGFSYRRVRPDRWFYELSLTRFAIHRFKTATLIRQRETVETISGQEVKSTDLGLRLEVGKLLNDPAKSRFNLGLSLGLEPYYTNRRFIPRTTAAFPYRFVEAGGAFELIPRVSVGITKKLTVGLQANPEILQLYYRSVRIQNPVLTLRQQRETNFETKAGLRNTNIHLLITYQL